MTSNWASINYQERGVPSLPLSTPLPLQRLIEFAAANRSGNAPSFMAHWECRVFWCLYGWHMFVCLVLLNGWGIGVRDRRRVFKGPLLAPGMMRAGMTRVGVCVGVCVQVCVWQGPLCACHTVLCVTSHLKRGGDRRSSWVDTALSDELRRGGQCVCLCVC